MYAIIVVRNKGLEGLKIEVIEQDFTDIQIAEARRVQLINNKQYPPQSINVMYYS